MYAAVSKKKNIVAKIATKSSPCAFCGREVDDEAKYGKLYVIGDLYCHYFCALLSCCLIQKGQDSDGLFGFLYGDILAEIARSKKHKCSFCGCDGANLGCTVSQCKKQFHLPCGRERQAVSMFYGNYKSYCAKHAPKQKISDTVMEKVRQRMSKRRLQNLTKAPSRTAKDSSMSEEDVTELACVICYEAVEGCPSVDTFWPPCCGRDAWFHRSCLERMCLSAGVHYLKCPLCNDKDRFGEAVLQQGYYIPDRDAAWELEQNAFSEIYNTTYSCGLQDCRCPNGRNHDAEAGPWDINLCVLCGSAGAHARCRGADEGEAKPYVCPTCTPSATSAPELIQALHELALQEQSAAESERVVRPLMPSRMSLRRTKGRPSTSCNNANNSEVKKEVSNTEISRLDLNLKTPKRCLPEPETVKTENKLLSPMKQLGLYDRISKLEIDTLNADDVVERIREKLKVPQPLAVKKKIVMAILEDLMNTTYKDKLKMKEPLREWISPKKCLDIIQEEVKIAEVEPNKENKTESIADTNPDSETKINESVPDSPKLKTIEIERDSSMEISKDNDTVNIDVVTREESKTTSTSPLKISFLKLSPNNKDRSNKLNVDIDIESFKMQYLSETSQVNSRKRKLSDADTKIDSQSQKEAKRRKHKEKKRKRDNEEKRIKIKLLFQKRSCVKEEAQKKDKLLKERSKLNKKRNKDKVKIKLKFKEQKQAEEKKTEKSKTNKNVKENVKIKLKFTKDSIEVDNREASSKKSKKLKKYKSKVDKDKEKKHNTERKEEKETLKESPKVMKQYQLNYFENKNTTPIVKPLNEVMLKRKYVKKEKGSDNLKQTSLDNFFSLNSPNLTSPKDGKM
ncbi:uncharacterized protein LOC121736477 [Aricia agestis]|uniref:uncharacterized protein LOC121736477 n=1 Tax=Aricia agestis TaxID=91739 RepID=UPI001C2045A4|nr:uncharacterized protein LOC121736477 [Aricia agestis]